jgi:hypothetical protein
MSVRRRERADRDRVGRIESVILDNDVVTRNAREFARVAGLNVEDWEAEAQVIGGAFTPAPPTSLAAGIVFSTASARYEAVTPLRRA